MKQLTRTRLRRIEQRRSRPGRLGRRHFVGVTDAGGKFDGWCENTAAGGFDNTMALMGIGGTLPEDLRRFTNAELAAFEKAGWQILCLRYEYLPGVQDVVDERQKFIDKWLPASR